MTPGALKALRRRAERRQQQQQQQQQEPQLDSRASKGVELGGTEPSGETSPRPPSVWPEDEVRTVFPLASRRSSPQQQRLLNLKPKPNLNLIVCPTRQGQTPQQLHHPSSLPTPTSRIGTPALQAPTWSLTAEPHGPRGRVQRSLRQHAPGPMRQPSSSGPGPSTRGTSTLACTCTVARAKTSQGHRMHKVETITPSGP